MSKASESAQCSQLNEETASTEHEITSSSSSISSTRKSKETDLEQRHETNKQQSEKDKEPYSTFTLAQMARMLTIVALTGMISPLTANIYVPALNQIQTTLNTDTESVNLTITVYMIFQAISPTFWGTLADSLGRRPILISTMLVYCGACIGLALTPNYTALIILRMLQAFGSSSVIAVGAGCLGDIADSKRRGTFFGIYSIGQLLGPVVGPVLGGVITDRLGWNWIFWILLMIGATSAISVGLFVPETLRCLVGNGSGYANPTPTQWIAYRRGKIDKEKVARIRKESGPVPKINFLRPFRYLMQPDVIILLVFNGLQYFCYYLYLTSTTKQFSIYYPYLSELQIGICFLCIGFGTISGSFVKGRLLDYDYRKTLKKLREKTGLENPQVQIYRARLGGAWPSIFFLQGTTIAYGWALQYGAPLPVVLILQFIIGFSISSISLCTQMLLLDLFPGQGASITASNNLIRCMLGAIASVVVDPGIEGVGPGWMFTIIGLILIVSDICIPILIKFGPQWKQHREDALLTKA